MRRVCGVLAMGLIGLACVVPVSGQDTVVPGDVPGSAAVSATGDESADAAQNIPGMAEFREAMRLFVAGDEPGAMAKLEEFNATQEIKTPAKIRLASFALQNREIPLARRLFDEVTRELPDAPEPYVILADLNRVSGNLTEANLLYAKGLELADALADVPRAKQSQVQVHTGLAMLASSRDDFAELRRQADALLAIDAENVAGLSFLSNCLFEDGDVDGSLAKLEEVKKVSPDALVSPKITLAMSFQNKGDQESAQKWMIEAIKEDMRSIPVRLAAAEWAMQTNQIAQAVEQLDIALQLDEKSVEAQHARGLAAMVQKDYAKAEEFFTKACELAEGNPLLTNDLVLALVMQNDPLKKQKAAGLAQANIQAHPNQAEALGTMGWVLSRNGQSERAEQCLSQACGSGMRVSANVLYYLARVLVDRGRKAESLMVLNTPLLQQSKFYLMKADADALRTVLEKDPTLRQPSATAAPATAAPTTATPTTAAPTTAAPAQP